MKLLEKATVEPKTGDRPEVETPDSAATLVVEVVPAVMRSIRTYMRGLRGPDVTVPQFRTLFLLHRQPGVTLSDVAEHVGLSLPSASKLVDGLVERGLVSRRDSPADRRRVLLAITEDGLALLETAHRGARACVAERLQGLSAEELNAIATAMTALRATFVSGWDAE